MKEPEPYRFVRLSHTTAQPCHPSRKASRRLQRSLSISPPGLVESPHRPSFLTVMTTRQARYVQNLFITRVRNMRLPPSRPQPGRRMFHLPTSSNSIPRAHSPSLYLELWTAPCSRTAVNSRGLFRLLGSPGARATPGSPFSRAVSAFARGALHENIDAVYRPPV